MSLKMAGVQFGVCSHMWGSHPPLSMLCKQALNWVPACEAMIGSDHRRSCSSPGADKWRGPMWSCIWRWMRRCSKVWHGRCHVMSRSPQATSMAQKLLDAVRRLSGFGKQHRSVVYGSWRGLYVCRRRAWSKARLFFLCLSKFVC